MLALASIESSRGLQATEGAHRMKRRRVATLDLSGIAGIASEFTGKQAWGEWSSRVSLFSNVATRRAGIA